MDLIPFPLSELNNTEEMGALEFGVAKPTGKLMYYDKREENMRPMMEAWAAKHVYPYISKDWLLNSYNLFTLMDNDDNFYHEHQSKNKLNKYIFQ